MRNRLPLSVLIAFIFIFGFLHMESHAFTGFAITCVNGVTDLGGGSYRLNINIAVSGWTDDGSGRDQGSHVYYDVNGNELGYFGEHHFHNYVGPVGWYTLNVGSDPGPWRVDVYDLLVAPVSSASAKAGTLVNSYWIYPKAVYPYCGSAVTTPPSTGGSAPEASGGEVSDIVYPSDNRINWQFGDLGAVLYRGTDAVGEPAINVYCYDGETTWLGMQTSQANMEDETSAAGCDVSFYYIDGAEYPYQWNIYYDGKLYETHCTDLTCETRTGSYFDPNE